MKNFGLNVPFNTVSFGQCSTAIARSLYKKNLFPCVFPISNQVDLSSQKNDDGFNKWLSNCINDSQRRYSRSEPSLKLWHINGALESYSSKGNNLITFFELDQLTPMEVHILKNQNKIYVTSNYTKDVFKMFGVESTYLPLGFDSHNFFSLEKRPTIQGVTSFAMFGKLEKRKGHFKVLNLWAKKYGNNQNYRLNCFVTNPFIKPEHQNALIAQALEGKQYSNIKFHPFFPSNAEYNQALQSSQIVISMSGGEGRDLPTFQATALGAWTVALKAHAYLDYLNDSNAVLVNPNSKIPAADGMFFAPNAPFNNGNIFDFADEDFYAGLEKAEKLASIGINTEGLKLQSHTYDTTVDILLADL